jgi:hypothetical protein
MLMKYAVYEVDIYGQYKIVSVHGCQDRAEKVAKKLGNRYGVATVSENARKGGFVGNFQL